MRFVISGYYGCGNAGDEAVLAGAWDALTRRSAGEASLTVLSQNPQQTEALHGLPAVDRMNFPLVRRTIRESDVLLTGGGSLLQDVTSVRSLLYYLWVARAGLNAGKPVMFYAQGIGPLRRKISRLLVRSVANRAAYVTVRDEDSASLLTAIGARKPTVEVTADPAFALDPAGPDEIDAIIAAESLPSDRPLLAVALRSWGDGAIDLHAKLLNELHRTTNAHVMVIPMQFPEDREFAGRVQSRIGLGCSCTILSRPYPPRALLGLVARAQALVAMRLHALIFAARAAVPLVALSYDPKVDSLMRALGRTDALVSCSGFDPTSVAEKTAYLIADREIERRSLLASADTFEELALRNADVALALARGERPAGSSTLDRK
jgi:polysaccharide pyruvyl transferase CsaB